LLNWQNLHKSGDLITAFCSRLKAKQATPRMKKATAFHGHERSHRPRHIACRRHGGRRRLDQPAIAWGSRLPLPVRVATLPRESAEWGAVVRDQKIKSE